MITRRIWPVVACLLLVSLCPSVSAASTQSPVTVPARSVEPTVRAYFADIPVMISIAKCESRFRQYDHAGRPLYNEDGTTAVGVMQIMYSVHGTKARELGMDIRTLKGNLAYARYLYKHAGTSPWSASRGCWR